MDQSPDRIAEQYAAAWEAARRLNSPPPDERRFLDMVPATERESLADLLKRVREKLNGHSADNAASAGEPKVEPTQCGTHDTSGPDNDTVFLTGRFDRGVLVGPAILNGASRQPADAATIDPSDGVSPADLDLSSAPSKADSATGCNYDDDRPDPRTVDPGVTLDPDASASSTSYGATIDPDQSMGDFSVDEKFIASTPRSKYPRVAGYEILSELGRGGMGVVYKARQKALNRLVALKMILSGSHAGADQLNRFRAEAEAVAQLHHHNIVQIYDVGEQDGLPYFSLEFIDGQPLDRFLDGKPQQARWSAKMAETLARAMHHAHEQGIVHRDLKPANVLLSTDGTPKVTDFGLVKRMEGHEESSQTRTGTIMGTPSYMAPEQGRGEKDIGPLADVYALGSMLYAFLCGRPPFLAATPLDTLMQLLKEDPVPPSRLQPKVPRDLETICLKCLQKEPAKRYGTALELADDLERFLRGEPIRARPVGRIERAWRWCRRNPRVASLSATVVVLLIASGAALSIAGVRELRERKNIEQVRQQVNEQIAMATKEIRAGDIERAQATLARFNPLLQSSSALSTQWREFRVLQEQIRVYGQLKELMNSVRYYGLFGAKGTLTKAQEACEEFVQLYDDLQANRGSAVYGLPPLDDQHLQLFREDVFEVNVVASQVESAMAETNSADARRQAAERALAWLARAEAVLPGTRFLHYRRAQVLRDLDDEAGSEKERALGDAIQPNSAVDRFWSAIGQHQRGREALLKHDPVAARSYLLAACSQYGDLLRIRPDHFWAYFDWASCQMQLDEPVSLHNAIVGFTACIQLKPDVAWPYYNRALAYYQLRKRDTSLDEARGKELLRQAIDDFTVATQLNPRYADAYYNRGLMHSELQEDQLSIDDITRAIAINDSNAIFYYQRGEVYRRQKQYDLSRADYGRAVQLDSNFYDVYAARAASFVEQARYAEAVADFDKLVELRGDDVSSYEKRGLFRLVAKNLNGALEDFRKVAELKPQDAANYYRMSVIFRVRRQLAEARQALETVCTLAPGFARGHLMLAHVHQQLGQYDEALRIIDGILPKIPQQDAGLVSGAWNDRADLLRAMERYDEAIESYDKSIDVFPKQSDAYLGIAAVHARFERWEDADKVYERMISADPQAARPYLRRAAYLRDQQRFVEALADCRQAQTLDGDSSLPQVIEASIIAAQGDAMRAAAMVQPLVTDDSSPSLKYAAACTMSLAAAALDATDEQSAKQSQQYMDQAALWLTQSLEEGFNEFSLQHYNRVPHEAALQLLHGHPRCEFLFAQLVP